MPNVMQRSVSPRYSARVPAVQPPTLGTRAAARLSGVLGHRGEPAVRRIHDQRRPPVLGQRAPVVEPPLGVHARRAVVVVQPLVLPLLVRRRLLGGQRLLAGELERALQRRHRPVVPDALQVGRAPRRTGVPSSRPPPPRSPDSPPPRTEPRFLPATREPAPRRPPARVSSSSTPAACSSLLKGPSQTNRNDSTMRAGSTAISAPLPPAPCGCATSGGRIASPG